jgi:adenylosuccinate synthase
MGWFDAVATRYGCMIQGATQTALTNLDVLGYLDEIPVCTAYRLENGEVTELFPATAQLAGAEPIMQNLPGWKCDISTVKEYADLPEEAKQYVDFVEKSTGVTVSMVSVGPRREQLIHR